MARPAGYQWEPLGWDTDPVPGDPQVISAEAAQLDKVVGRYEKVAAALRGWGPELEQAQRLSVQALNQAEVPYAKLRQQVILPTGSNLTAAQQQVTSYHAGLFDAIMSTFRWTRSNEKTPE